MKTRTDRYNETPAIEFDVIREIEQRLSLRKQSRRRWRDKTTYWAIIWMLLCCWMTMFLK